MTFHPDAISDQQKTVLRELGSVAAEHGFYLAGGTAVALHLGHRRSVDLDWFTEDSLSDPMRWAQQLRDAGVALTTSSIDEGTLHGSVHGVRVSFLEYRYPLLQPRISWDACEVELAALDDLACMKLSAIAQRGAKKDRSCVEKGTARPLRSLLPLPGGSTVPRHEVPPLWKAYWRPPRSLENLCSMLHKSEKDFVDVYALVREHRSLPVLVDRYRQKYDTDDVAHLLYALVYFDDADAERMPDLLWDVDWAVMKESIRTWVQEMVQ